MGFAEDNKPLLVPADTADNVRYIFEQILLVKPQRTIADDLATKGQHIRRATMSDLLRNLVYMGKILVPADENELMQIVDGKHEGLISPELFYKVNQLLTENNAKRNRRKYNSAKDELFLRGVLVCSKCGQPLTGSRSRGAGGERYYYYHCNHCRKERFRADAANRNIVQILSSFKFKNEVKVLYNEILKEILSGDEEERKRKITKLKAELSNIELKISTAQDLLVEGAISKDDFQSMRQRYITNQKKIKDELEEMSADQSAWTKHLETGIGFLTNLEKTFNLATPNQKREILCSTFPEKIIFEKNKSRTGSLNEVLYHMLQIDSNIQKQKTGQIHKNLILSGQVELIGVEPTTS